MNKNGHTSYLMNFTHVLQELLTSPLQTIYREYYSKVTALNGPFSS
jgi:hypothetical protein